MGAVASCGSCGRSHFSDHTGFAYCCGNRVTVRAAKSDLKKLEGNRRGHGDRFLELHPELFRGGGCKCSDAVAMMNRWGAEKTLAKRDVLAKLLKRPSTGMSFEEVRAAITRFAGRSFDSAAAIDVTSINPIVPDNMDEVLMMTPHFNPNNTERMAATYYEWLPSLGDLAQHIKPYELVFDWGKQELDGSRVVRGGKQNLMWQKEALINLALKETPSHIKYFAWLDHDICLADPEWLVKGIAKIDEGYSAVQLFSDLQYWNKNRTEIVRRSQGRAFHGVGAPGGMWIASVEYLRKIGGLMYDHIVGSGDEYFIGAVNHNFRLSKLWTEDSINGKMRESVVRYCESAAKIPSKASGLEGNGYHIWHGDMKNRQYDTRRKILSKYDFDPEADVQLNQDGILEWSTNKTQLHEGVAAYLLNRKEDD